MPKHRIARRRKLAQLQAETAAYFDAVAARVCVCGATNGEHDLAYNFTQPCEATGCKDFRLAPVPAQKECIGEGSLAVWAVDPGHTPPDMGKLGACTPEDWRNYLYATTPEEREVAR